MTTEDEWAPAQMSSRAAILEQCTQTARLRALFQDRGAGTHSFSVVILYLAISCWADEPIGRACVGMFSILPMGGLSDY